MSTTDRRPADIRRHTAIAVGVAVLLCVAGAAVSVFTIYLPDRAADQTRAAVNAQGPNIVTEMLTYDPKSLKQDFARARSLTTDKYRPELVKQQESVQKGHPVVNEYWVTDSTVLSATRIARPCCCSCRATVAAVRRNGSSLPPFGFRS